MGTAHICMEWRPQVLHQPRKLNMTQSPQLRRSSRIARRAAQKGARPAVPPQAAIEKLATGENNKPPERLLKAKNELRISTFNVQTLRKDEKLPELIACSEETNQDIICIQEHRYFHEDLPTKEHTIGSWKLITCSAWKNDANAAVGGIGILLNSKSYKSISNIEMITNRIMVATFNGNPKTTLICCYSPTNVSDEDQVDNFYETLESLTRRIPKHNLLVIGGDFNAHLGRQNGFRNSYHQQQNRNGIKLKDYLQASDLLCLNTLFTKRINQLWTHKNPNGSLAQLDFVLINKKWKNSAKNCRAFNSFVSVCSDHRIVTAQIALTLRSNKKTSNTKTAYDWSSLKNPDIASSFVTTVTNKFAILSNLEQNSSANEMYEQFETACKEAANTTIPQKQRSKKRKPWENEEIRNKRQQLHRAQQLKESFPSPENIRKLNNATTLLKEAYKLEQTKYLENKITHIRNSATNKQSAEAWKAVNEITGRKASNSAKLKAENQEERVKLWENHFKDLLGKPPQVTDELITPIVQEELNITKGNFTMEELTSALKKHQKS